MKANAREAAVRTKRWSNSINVNRIRRKWLRSAQTEKVLTRNAGYMYLGIGIYTVTNLRAFNLFVLMSPNKRCEWSNSFVFKRGVTVILSKRYKRTFVRNYVTKTQILKILFRILFFFRKPINKPQSEKLNRIACIVNTQYWYNCDSRVCTAQSLFNYWMKHP